jgi:hypothetical protein
LLAFGQVVEHIGRFMHPTPLHTGRRKNLGQCLPKP